MFIQHWNELFWPLLVLRQREMFTLPLALFATGARLIPYYMVGLINYISPSLQLMLGVFLYGEPFAGAGPAPRRPRRAAASRSCRWCG